MKNFVVNKDSWHYRMNARVLRDGKHFLPNEIENIMKHKSNFCAYWRMTTSNIMNIAFMIFVIILIICLLLFGAYKLFIFFYTAAGTEIVGIFSFVAVFVLFFLTASFIEKYLKSRKKKLKLIAKGEYIEPQAGLFKTKYMTWKQKICPPVEYK